MGRTGFRTCVRRPYFTVTALEAVPPMLDLTVTVVGAGDVVTCRAYVFVFAL